MQELIEQSRSEPKFEELGADIAEGREFGSVRFNEFLMVGIEHWNMLAKQGGDFAQKFADLAAEYTKALNSGRDERVAFLH